MLRLDVPVEIVLASKSFTKFIRILAMLYRAVEVWKSRRSCWMYRLAMAGQIFAVLKVPRTIGTSKWWLVLSHVVPVCPLALIHQRTAHSLYFNWHRLSRSRVQIGHVIRSLLASLRSTCWNSLSSLKTSSSLLKMTDVCGGNEWPWLCEPSVRGGLSCWLS